MKILDRALGAIGLERRSTIGLNGWPVPLAASAVNATSAQGVSTVYACVQAIAETTASLPLILFRRGDDGDRERASDHPLYRVLHDMANPEQTALEFREYMMACVMLRGKPSRIMGATPSPTAPSCWGCSSSPASSNPSNARPSQRAGAASMQGAATAGARRFLRKAWTSRAYQ